jgi:cyclic beta-1,2-glucan synthetase
LAVIGIILIPSLIASALNVFQKPVDVTLGQHLAAEVRSARRHFVQAFTLVCLPYEAFFSLDAMVRTGWRMLITHKRLLQWNPSGDSDRKAARTLPALAGPCGLPPSWPSPRRFI